MFHVKHFKNFIDNFFNQKLFSSNYKNFKDQLKSNDLVDISGFEFSTFSIFTNHLYQDMNKNVLVVTSKNEYSEKIRDNLDFQFNKDIIGFLPEDIEEKEHVYSEKNDSFFYNDCKNKLYDDNKYIYLTSSSGLNINFPDKSDFEQDTLLIEKGMEIERSFLVDLLINYGYNREDTTTFPEEFSIKGSVLDVYVPGFSFPYRIEFFGDRIDSVRQFNPEDQRTVRKLNSFKLFPLNEKENDNKVSILDILEEQKTLLLYFDKDNLNTDELGNYNNDIPKINHHRYITTEIDFPIFEIDIINKSVKGLKDFIKKEDDTTVNFRIFSSINKQIERLNSIFKNHSNVNIFKGYFTDSFYLKDLNEYIISENDFFSHSYKTRLTNKKLPSDIDVEKIDMSDISKGDLMVHIDYGIGEFQGLEKVEAFNNKTECMKLRYKNSDSVYVPLEKLNQVKEYRNSGKEPPSLTNLNSGQWERKKAKTKESAEEIVEELITLYSIRKNSTGYEFSSDDDLQIEMESEFPYQETPGQIKATQEIKADMENPEPMDRLLCGDVGFGKTEVAMRAAFKAVLDSKQVAVLVPTTILAEQHYDSFIDRLENYPVIIRQLSRFVTRSNQREILEDLRNGNIDIIIGTHRLLSEDIEFDDLGLLIIDEEHRFGVKSKNRIKNYKKNLDVLSLSATPIPRTLQFSLIGARDFSLLKTPPKYRLPIVTEIINFDEEFIKNRVDYELNRNGQIYFVHNEVKTIKTFTTKIHSIYPEASIEYAHGQMKESKLEAVIRSFIDKKVDILVTTTIIESGIDIPNVNTMFINKANQFGLAQLYQLRGRVGRSNKRAFCYLIAPKMKKLNDDAVKRLKTIKRYTSLGSGYDIALSDMQIRGAGNLFGVEQSGNIQRIGYDLYVKILEDKFEEKKEEINESLKIQEDDQSLKNNDINIISPYPSYIDDEYIESENIRLDFYRKISNCSKFDELDNIKEELLDRFGKLPKNTKNLFKISKIKIYGIRNSIRKYVIKENKTELSFNKDQLKDKVNKLLIIVKNICNKFDISYKFKPSEGFGVILYFQENSLEQIIDFLDKLDDSLKLN